MSEYPALSQLQAEIDTTISLGRGTEINTCFTLYKIIERANPADKGALIQHAAEGFDSAESSEEIEIDSFINATEEKQLQEKYGDLVDEMLKLLLDENPPEDQFYQALGDLLLNPILRDEKSRAFALYYFLIDKRLPYFHLESGLRMSDEDWRITNQRLSKQKTKIRFILATDFSQRSEKADLLLKELDAVERHEERVTLLGYIVHESGDGVGRMALLQRLARISDR